MVFLGTSIWGISRSITKFRVLKVGPGNLQIELSSVRLMSDDEAVFFCPEQVSGPLKWNFQWRNAKNRQNKRKQENEEKEEKEEEKEKEKEEEKKEENKEQEKEKFEQEKGEQEQQSKKKQQEEKQGETEIKKENQKGNICIIFILIYCSQNSQQRKTIV